MRRCMRSGDFDFVLFIYFYEGVNPSLKANSATSPYEVADASIVILDVWTRIPSTPFLHSIFYILYFIFYILYFIFYYNES